MSLYAAKPLSHAANLKLLQSPNNQEAIEVLPSVRQLPSACPGGDAAIIDRPHNHLIGARLEVDRGARAFSGAVDRGDNNLKHE